MRTSGQLARARGAVVASIIRRAVTARLPDPLPAESAIVDLLPWLRLTGTGPLVWHALRGSGLDDRAWYADLARDLRNATARALHADAELARLWSALLDAGLTPLLGKGPAAASAYPARGLRPFSDLDVYVPSGQHSHAADVVARVQLRDMDVDLHRGSGHLSDIAFDHLLAESTVRSVSGVEVRMLGRGHLLRLVALHALAEGVIRPIWLADIAFLMNSEGDALDWHAFEEGDARRAQWALVALRLAHELLGADASHAPAVGDTPAPAWAVRSVLSAWGRQLKPKGARGPMSLHRGRVTDVMRAVAARWPTAIEAVAGVGTSVPRHVALGHQIRESVRRTLVFLRAPPLR